MELQKSLTVAPHNKESHKNNFKDSSFKTNTCNDIK